MEPMEESYAPRARRFALEREGYCVNLPLDSIQPALLGRVDFQQKLINKAPRVINDDVITFNTQTSTQWDSFRHFAYQEEGKFYNGVTQTDIHDTPSSTVNGIDGWSEKVIAGRGVLIDYASWAAKQRTQKEQGYNSSSEAGLTAHAITVADLESILAESGVTLRTGDILFLRTGYLASYTALDKAGREKLVSSSYAWPGLEQSESMLRWLWERQFAGVAGDNPGLEVVPPVNPTWQLQPILLAGWARRSASYSI